MTTTTATIDVLGIDNVLFAVGDLGKARRFYEHDLGFALKFAIEEVGIALFALGKEAPGLLIRDQHAPEATSPSGPRVWLEVADARSTAKELERRGVRLLAEPFEVFTGWTVEVADAWGNVIGFTDYVKSPERGRGPLG